MSRRILLIDNDMGYAQFLAEAVAPYQVQVEVVGDQGDPLAHIAHNLPALLMIAVEEPQKLGYALCNRAKKGLAGNVPVMLITASVSPDGFANHRKLKAHADEYLDKRTASADELLQKIDTLIALGDPEYALDVVAEESDDAPIPVEVDGGDDFIFAGGDPETTGGFTEAGNGTQLNRHAGEQMLEVETDAAFDALTAFEDDLPAAPAVSFRSSAAAIPTIEIADDIYDAAPESGDLYVPQVEPVDLIPFEDEPLAGPHVALDGEANERTATESRALLSALPTVTQSAPTRPRSPSVDLGLNEVAADAFREQSQISDRRALQRIGELEAVVARLDQELEEAKRNLQTSEGRAREAIRLRQELDARQAEILTLQERAQQATASVQQLEAKLHSATTGRSSTESKSALLEARVATLNEQLRNTEANLAAAQASLDTVQRDHANKLTSLEAQLATMQAERADLVAARAETSSAFADARGELEATIAQLTQERDAARAEHKHAETRVERARTDLSSQISSLREELRAQHDAALRELQTELEAAHAAALAQLQTEAQTAAAAAQAAEIETRRLAEKQRVELSAERTQLHEQVQALTQELTAAKSQTQQLVTSHRQALEALTNDWQAKLAEAQANHSEALAATQASAQRHADEALTALRAELHAREASLEAVTHSLTNAQGAAEAQQHELADLRGKYQEASAQLADAETLAATHAQQHSQLVDQLTQERHAAEQAARQLEEFTHTLQQHQQDVAHRAQAQQALEQALALAHSQRERTAEELSTRTEEHANLQAAFEALGQAHAETQAEAAELTKGLASARHELTTQRHTIEELSAARDAATVHAAAQETQVREREELIATLRQELQALEQENAGYQDQVLRAYQRLRNDEALVTRAKKAMAIALTVLDDAGRPADADPPEPHSKGTHH